MLLPSWAAPRMLRPLHGQRFVVLLIMMLIAVSTLGAAGAQAATYTPPSGDSVCLPNGAPYSTHDCGVWYLGNQPSVNGYAEVQGWAPGVSHPVGVNVADSNGQFQGYMIDADGTPNPVTQANCFTCSISPGGTTSQRGISTFFVRNGVTYAVVTVQDSARTGSGVDDAAQPGKGQYNDIYIAKVNSNGTLGAYTLLYKLNPLTVNTALIWPEVDATGSKIVWAQMYQALAPYPVGSWQLREANLTWSGGMPAQLTDENQINAFPSDQPAPGSGRNAFYEPYGFDPRGNVLFSSSYGHYNSNGGNIVTNNQIYTLPATLAGSANNPAPSEPLPTQLTNGSGDDEFAFFYDSTHMIYGGTTSLGHLGLDWWIQSVNASGQPSGSPERLTGFNGPEYANVGGWAIDPSNRHHILFGVCEGQGASVLNPCPGSDVWSFIVSP